MQSCISGREKKKRRDLSFASSAWGIFTHPKERINGLHSFTGSQGKQLIVGLKPRRRLFREAPSVEHCLTQSVTPPRGRPTLTPSTILIFTKIVIYQIAHKCSPFFLFPPPPEHCTQDKQTTPSALIEFEQLKRHQSLDCAETGPALRIHKLDSGGLLNSVFCVFELRRIRQ